MASVTGNSLCTGAYREIGVLAEGETMGAGLADLGMDRLNLIVDSWNAERDKVLVETFNEFTLVPSLQPHTIGPSAATFTVSSRPVSIEAANVIFNANTPTVRQPIAINDWQQWNEESVPDLETAWPTDLYYAPEWPNGQLFFWPIPTTAYPVELVYRAVLSAFVLNTTVSLPPGYKAAYLYTLAEDLCNALGRQMPETLPMKASKARAAIGANNTLTPRLTTRDSGVPSAPTNRSDFNYLTGLRI